MRYIGLKANCPLIPTLIFWSIQPKWQKSHFCQKVQFRDVGDFIFTFQWWHFMSPFGIWHSHTEGNFLHLVIAAAWCVEKVFIFGKFQMRDRITTSAFFGKWFFIKLAQTPDTFCMFYGFTILWSEIIKRVILSFCKGDSAVRVWCYTMNENLGQSGVHFDRLQGEKEQISGFSRARHVESAFITPFQSHEWPEKVM